MLGRKIRVLTVFGTRPEAIKLAPVVRALTEDDAFQHGTCVSGQHRQMLDQVLSVFDIVPEFDLDIMRAGQDLAHVTTSVLNGVQATIDSFRPDWLIVQGDTTTAFSAALAAFYRKVAVAHVEAGLRTGNIRSPWPEEANRRLITQIATLHFPPTFRSAANLAAEKVDAATVTVTGNTVIDALQSAAARLRQRSDLQAELVRRFAFLDPTKRLILVTGHRRENFDGGIERVCVALRALADRGDIEILYPVHLNPNVQGPVRRILGGHPSIHLLEPLDYLPFIYLLERSYLVVTDSGGIQEEAPGLAKPVLVTRDTTERPEAIEAGTARLVGTDGDALTHWANRLLDDEMAYAAMARAANPFGDGKAAARIAERLKQC